MTSQIQILLPPEPIELGDTITVSIRLTLDEPTIARCVFAEFRAGETTKARYSASKIDRKGWFTKRKTAYENISRSEENYLLAGSKRLGFLERIGDSFARLLGRGGSCLQLEPGSYEYPFEVWIPDFGCPSFSGQNCWAFFTLRAVFDCPNKIDLVDNVSLKVAKNHSAESRPITIRYPEDARPGFWDKALGADAKLRLSLESNVLSSGEIVKGCLQLDDENAMEMKSAKVRLVGIESVTAGGHSDTHEHRSADVRILGDLAFRNLSEEFEFEAHFDNMPPTVIGQNFRVDWFIEVELELPWAKNPTIRWPVTVV